MVAVSVATGVLAAAAVLVAAAFAQRDRRTRRRLARTIARLGGEPVPPGSTVDAELEALERAADQANRHADAALASVRLIRALNAIPQGVVICDERGEVVFENEVGHGFAQGRHGEALVAAAITDLLEAATRGAAASRELELYGPPRRTLVIDAYPLTSPSPASPGGALAVIADVSERRRLENVRRDFVANISHELKTPVGALALLAETLLDAEDGEDRARLARRMLDEAHRVGHTIDDLLSLSRIEADQSREWDDVDVGAVIAEASDRAASAAEQRRITVERQPGRSLTLRGDPRQLVSALFNLVDNAIKYSDPGSSVLVAARRDGNWIELSVADNGPGIPSRDLERIFERFYRVDRARSRETGGTGLGLAIVRHVATNHGGVVTVDSREGEGSKFTLRLPASPAAPPGEPDRPALVVAPDAGPDVQRRAV